MKKDDFYLSILTGIISGLIVLFGSFAGEHISNLGLKIGIILILCFILFVVFIKVLERKNNKP